MIAKDNHSDFPLAWRRNILNLSVRPSHFAEQKMREPKQKFDGKMKL